MQTATETSIGLSSRTAATLAYVAWWVTGLMFWMLEREDRFVRFHAAQAVTAFGAIAVVILVFLTLAAASLSFFPSAFVGLLVAAGGTWVGGLVLWLVAMWKTAGGDLFRIPLAARWADWMNRES
jgi:uncharacterized membrane protein